LERLMKQTKGKMAQTLAAVRGDFATIRTGRANPALLDHLKVAYYGTEMPVNQLANISVPESRLIVIQPWDKSAISPIEKAILTSDLGLTPTSDGEVVRVTLPQLTQERRQQLSKIVQQKAEEGRVAIRNIRRDTNSAIDKMEKSKSISEDEVYRKKSEVQDLTDEFIEKIDEAMQTKIDEIMEI